MIVITRVRSKAELKAIETLQQANLKKNISPEESVELFFTPSSSPDQSNTIAKIGLNDGRMKDVYVTLGPLESMEVIASSDISILLYSSHFKDQISS